MYDPVLNRPMFQGPSSTAQGSSTPSAKGTGITSMVTAPDQGAQQLKTFSTQIAPTIRGFAGGGFFGGEQLPPTPYGEQGQNPEWGHEGQPYVLARSPMPMSSSPTIPSTYESPVQGAIGAAVDQAISNPSSRYSFNSSNYMPRGQISTPVAPSSYAVNNRVSEAQMRTPAPIQPPGNFYQPSFADLPKYAAGGPVQHFEGGGIASMWDNFVKSLRVEEPNRSGNYRLPDVGLRIGQQSDYRKDAGITGGTPNYVEPIDIGGPRAVYDEGTRNPELYGETPITRPGLDAMSRLNPAPTRGEVMLPREEAPSRMDDREAARGAGFSGITQEPRPPMPGPGIQTDTTVNPVSEKPRGEISTHLADIKAERASQSAADRRENALMALMSAGFGMAAGKSRHALTNIAEGGQQGIGTFAQLEKGRREDENRRYLSALHEKEVALRERELNAREPLLKAQSDYYAARPGIEADKLAARDRKIVADATTKAEIEVTKMEKNNPLAFYTNGKPNPIAKEIARNKLLEQYKREYADHYKAGIPNAGNSLGLDLSAPE